VPVISENDLQNNQKVRGCKEIMNKSVLTTAVIRSRRGSCLEGSQGLLQIITLPG